MGSFDEVQADLQTLEDQHDKMKTDLTAAQARITALEGQLADCQDGGTPPPDPTPEGRHYYLGMAAEMAKWDAREALTGPQAGRRIFKSSWSVNGIVEIAKLARETAGIPYVSSKLSPHSWQQVALGALDEDGEELGHRLGALGYPVRLTFHHEPRGGNIDQPTELVPWSKALVRLFGRVKAGAGANAGRIYVGPTDNGHPWGAEWGHLTDAQIAVYWTDDLLEASDVIGADFYDGATNTNRGEPSWIKMKNFEAWADRRGFKPGKQVLDAGEWNFVKPQDCLDTWEFLKTSRFWGINLFNSAENTRPDLPSELQGSWELRPGTERLEVYQEVCRQSGLPGPGRAMSRV